MLIYPFFYAEDAATGDTEGQGVDGVWFIVEPTGDAIKPAATGVASMPVTARSTAAPVRRVCRERSPFNRLLLKALP